METLKVLFAKETASSTLQLELDEEKNEGATVFLPGKEAYIRLFPSGENPQLAATIGGISIDAGGLPLEVTEDIVLINTTTVSTKYPVFEIEDFEWFGRHWGDGKPQVVEKKITLSEKTTGVLRVRYKTYYDRLVATCNEEGTQLIVAQKGANVAYISVKWKEIEKEVVIIVKDACTRAVIEGAKVYLDGKFAGLTNSSGKINLGKVRIGKHKVRVVKEGYQSTDADNIKNDYFVVSDD